MASKPPLLDPSQWSKLDSNISGTKTQKPPSQESERETKLSLDLGRNWGRELKNLLYLTVILFALIGAAALVNQKTTWLETAGDWLVRTIHIV